MKFLHAYRFLGLSYSALLFGSSFVLAQGPGTGFSISRANQLEASVSLPDSPGTLLASDSATLAADDTAADAQAASAGGPSAPRYHRIIKSYETAQPLTAKDKFVLAVKGQVGINTIASSLVSAGMGQLNDSRPHYGTDRGAFGERLGASALNGATRAFFSYGVYASLFHQDPRYYVMGDTHTFKHRAIYSATRVVLVGAPGQHSSVNWSNIAGTASSATLANAYYPAIDRVASKTVTSALTSLATQAGISEVHEFLGDVLKKIHHKK